MLGLLPTTDSEDVQWFFSVTLTLQIYVDCLARLAFSNQIQTQKVEQSFSIT